MWGVINVRQRAFIYNRKKKGEEKERKAPVDALTGRNAVLLVKSNGRTAAAVKGKTTLINKMKSFGSLVVPVVVNLRVILFPELNGSVSPRSEEKKKQTTCVK